VQLYTPIKVSITSEESSIFSFLRYQDISPCFWSIYLIYPQSNVIGLYCIAFISNSVEPIKLILSLNSYLTVIPSVT
jgi:hypothetical protein